MLQQINLRLKMIYDMIPQCNKLGDVGTDHGFLPIYSVQTGKCKYAIASDLREGPLYIANKNISENGLSDKIQTMKCNGMDGYSDKNCDVIVIAGMGGITICNILSDWLAKAQTENHFPGNNTLILQPNTHDYEVRRFLWDNGFTITDEQAIKDGNHTYIALKTLYTGKNESYSILQLYLGKIMTLRKTENDILYFNALKRKYSNILKGLSMRNNPSKEILDRINLSKDILKELDCLL